MFGKAEHIVQTFDTHNYYKIIIMPMMLAHTVKKPFLPKVTFLFAKFLWERF